MITQITLLVQRYVRAGFLLLLFTVFTLFILPSFPVALLPVCYPVCFTGIFLASSFSLQKARKFYAIAAMTLIVVLLLAIAADLEWLQVVSRSLQFVYFLIVVVALVREIASSKQVDEQVIISSIVAYFLLGLAFALMATILARLIPGAYSIDMGGLTGPQRYESLRDMTYFTFVTYTTTGYGDLLPVKPAARSLALLIASSGQLYIAIIIAMLVGKYTSTKS